MTQTNNKPLEAVKEILVNLRPYSRMDGLTIDEKLTVYPELKEAATAINKLIVEARQNELEQILSHPEYGHYLSMGILEDRLKELKSQL